MKIYVYICPKCEEKLSLNEFNESRFCRNCEKLLTYHDRRALEEETNKEKRRKKFKLDESVEQSIEKTYSLIQQNIPSNIQIDSLEVVKQVEEYRQFWKPKKTNVVLLAESHVYTDEQDYKIKCERSILHKLLPDYPDRFVRFVYCLGYGENELMTKIRTDRKNTGTPQYWKIFSSCVAKNENDLGFGSVLKTGTYFEQRLRSKVNILRKMKKRGMWLLDASIVGLYGSGKKNHTITEMVLKICWRNFIASTIEESAPKDIVVIGKGVGRILERKLLRINVPVAIIPQPQARGTSRWQLENFKKYQRICARYA